MVSTCKCWPWPLASCRPCRGLVKYPRDKHYLPCISLVNNGSLAACIYREGQWLAWRLLLLSLPSLNAPSEVFPWTHILRKTIEQLFLCSVRLFLTAGSLAFLKKDLTFVCSLTFNDWEQSALRETFCVKPPETRCKLDRWFLAWWAEPNAVMRCLCIGK